MTRIPGDAPPACLNCGAPLAGQYCGQCGQRASSRLISLFELLRDAFGDLFELDSRLWRTLVPLLVRPGRLTREYLQGRRARYMPPFRMYLVLSLIFFVVAFFDPRTQFAILYEPNEPVEPADPALAEERRAQIKAQTREILDELVREGVVDERALQRAGVLADEPPASVATGATGETGETGADEKRSYGLKVTMDDDGTDCGFGEGSLEFAPEFLKRRFSAQRLEQVCERVREVGAGGVFSAVLDNVPAALIVLLPLMAFVLKLLYPLSRRYYVEHLLFFVHFHAFLFLLLTLQILWARLNRLTGMPEAVGVLPVVAMSFYIPVYLFKSMRQVYGQHWLTALLKFFALSTTYAGGFTLVMFGAVLIAVFSV